MNGDDLVDIARMVASRRDFLSFMDILIQNRKKYPGEWDNNDLDSYLYGLAGFTQGMEGYFKNIGENVDADQLTWRALALMLLAAKVYE
ncbi:hypothetical protein JDN40_12410 [Rhodomicrobium vannielii ATCC 17100]|uniref:DUF7660 family protein n=1 Tax=Rhodomicrobium vannielii TaxID=1069 RepID=UPI001918F035|nr:hypothetical protein [Rhodomicrobium vannielii]MBJ7534910.1 hypothetical protein [Rhodomicrobium vannielii ATCC 17100]